MIKLIEVKDKVRVEREMKEKKEEMEIEEKIKKDFVKKV